MNENFEIVVPGSKLGKGPFKIKSGTIYTITPKIDPSAPDAAPGSKGFKEYNTTKPINPQLTNTINAPFDAELGIWDLGFNRNSPCLRGMSKEDIEDHIKKVHKYIVTPVEQLKGEGFLSHSGTNRALDDFTIDIGLETFFNTDDPIHLLKLYLVVLSKEVAPKEEERNPLYKKADFCLENKESKVNNLHKRQLDSDQAVFQLYKMLDSNEDFALRVLDYVGVPAKKGMQPTTLNQFFRKWLDNKTERSGANAEYFLKVVENFSTDSGKEELYVYEQLEELLKKGVLTYSKSDFYLDGEVIGQNLKVIAEQATTVDKGLKNRIVEYSLKVE